jgi:HlyD family secretion protein
MTEPSPIRRWLPWLSSGEADDPAPEIALGLGIIVLFFGLLLGGAAFVPLDAAAYAPGQVAVANHRQTIQHKEGGIVRRIDVAEGQHVVAGQLLLELAGADVVAANRGLTSELVELQAQRARLLAEQRSQSSITWPPEFAQLAASDQPQVSAAKAVQQAEFTSRRMALAAHKAVIGQRINELSEQIEGYRRQIDATQTQEKLIADELAEVKTLANQGYAPIAQVRSLERNAADLEGHRGEFSAQIAQTQQQAGELKLQMIQLDTDEREQISKDLHDVENQLNDALPRLQSAADQLKRMDVRAPLSGTVVGLKVFTAGGVVAPGQTLLDIVPDSPQLVVRVDVAPADVDNLHVGQVAEVRFGGKNRTLPIVKGAVTQLSADSLTDEKTGKTFFTAEVTLPPDQIDLLKEAKGGLELKPGTPAQVVIPTAKRSALQFLFEPLSRTLWRSFRER